MHHIYHTEALVISYENVGEADRVFFLYTKQLGFLYAKAQGIRRESSKLRFILQPFTYVYLDLVKGKAVWRITSAVFIEQLISKETETFVLTKMHNIVGLLYQSIPALVPDEVLFSDLRNAFLKLVSLGTSESLAQKIELALLVRILSRLGYITDKDIYVPFLEDRFSYHTFQYDTVEVSKLSKEINTVLSNQF